MNELRKVWLYTRINFGKWPVNPRVYIVAAAVIAFSLWNISGLMQYADSTGYKISPWIFPHLFTPVMIVAYGCFTALLFSNAPFADSHMPFIMVRSGRLAWISGQILYIVITGFIYTVFQLLISIFILLPQISLTIEWGIIMTTLAANPSAMHDVGINTTIGISPSIVNQFSPIAATLIAFGLCWLVTVFSGMVIFSSNIILGKTSGLALIGWFIFFSYFALYLGRLTLAPWLFYLSPLNWSSMDFIDWSGIYRSILPSPQYAIISLSAAILLMTFASIKVFCDRDVEFPDGGI